MAITAANQPTWPAALGALCCRRTPVPTSSQVHIAMGPACLLIPGSLSPPPPPTQQPGEAYWGVHRTLPLKPRVALPPSAPSLDSESALFTNPCRARPGLGAQGATHRLLTPLLLLPLDRQEGLSRAPLWLHRLVREVGGGEPPQTGGRCCGNPRVPLPTRLPPTASSRPDSASWEVCTSPALEGPEWEPRAHGGFSDGSLGPRGPARPLHCSSMLGA